MEISVSDPEQNISMASGAYAIAALEKTENLRSYKNTCLFVQEIPLFAVDRKLGKNLQTV